MGWKERMVKTKFLRYLVIIPCVIALFLILTASSKAETDTVYQLVAMEQSSTDESSIPDNIISILMQDSIPTEDTNEDSVERDYAIMGGSRISANEMAMDSINAFTFADANVKDLPLESKIKVTIDLTQFENGTQNENDNDSNQNESKYENRVNMQYDCCSDSNLWLFWDKASVSSYATLPANDRDAVTNDRSSYAQFQPFDEDTVQSAPKKPPPQALFNGGKSKAEKSRFSCEIVTIHVDPPPKLGLVMFSRIVNPIASSNIRGEIVEYVRANPGEHMSKIKRKLKISTSSAVHHLRILEKTGLILAHKDGKYKRYFVNENGYRSSINGEYKSIFSVLKNQNSREIASFLISKPYSTLSEVSKMINLNPSSTHWHVERLEDAKIISKVKDGKFVRYFIADTELVEKALTCLNTR